jgi:hypothetical protein
MQNLKHLPLISFFLVFAISACQEPEGIGLDVLPDGEEMPIAWIDTFTIEARTVRVDSVRTSGRGTYVIGDFGDPIFGRVKSQMFTQFRLSVEPTLFGDQPQLDSVVLNLAYSGAYGRIDKLKGTHNFGVYEVDEGLVDDSTYYSDDLAAVSATALTEVEFKPDLLNSIPAQVDEDTLLPPSFRLRLPDDFGNRLLNSPNLASNELFAEEFKGLNIRSESSNMPQDFGSLLYFNLDNRASALELYFSNTEDDSLSYRFDINNQNAIYVNVDREFSSELTNAMDQNQSVGDEKLYIQSLAGTRVRASFPFLRELNELGAVAINKAELVLPVDEASLDDFGLPAILAVNRINAGNSALVIIDSFEPNGIDYYGGIYDSESQEYVFNIARHLQSVLSNAEETDYGIYITSLNAVDGRRGVFNGPEHPTKPMKLRMTYTIID